MRGWLTINIVPVHGPLWPVSCVLLKRCLLLQSLDSDNFIY